MDSNSCISNSNISPLEKDPSLVNNIKDGQKPVVEDVFTFFGVGKSSGSYDKYPKETSNTSSIDLSENIAKCENEQGNAIIEETMLIKEIKEEPILLAVENNTVAKDANEDAYDIVKKEKIELLDHFGEKEKITIKSEFDDCVLSNTPNNTKNRKKNGRPENEHLQCLMEEEIKIEDQVLNEKCIVKQEIVEGKLL